MTKIIINIDYGGWCLSEMACEQYRAITGRVIEAGDSDNRADPILARIVENLGNSASESYSRLRVEDIPKGTRYYIHEYDGSEVIVTEDQHSWLVA